MLAYSIVLFAVAALFTGLGIPIRRGRTDLIQEYHQTSVTDKAAYAKAVGTAMLGIAGALLLSGVIGLFKPLLLISVAMLAAGLVIGVASMVAIQIKYNRRAS